MRCEEVRRRLPEHVGEGEPFPHELEIHLATCAACAAEEGRYRSVATATRALRYETEPPPRDLADSVMALVGRPRVAWRGRVRQIRYDPMTRYAAASLGGVVVGAAAIAVLLRRSARRALAI